MKQRSPGILIEESCKRCSFCKRRKQRTTSLASFLSISLKIEKDRRMNISQVNVPLHEPLQYKETRSVYWRVFGMRTGSRTGRRDFVPPWSAHDSPLAGYSTSATSTTNTRSVLGGQHRDRRDLWLLSSICCWPINSRQTAHHRVSYRRSRSHLGLALLASGTIANNAFSYST